MASSHDNFKRKERYRELRALGFSPQEARKLRDRSGSNIQKEISREQRRISRKPEALRSAKESFRLTRIQQRNASENFLRYSARFESRRERWEKFSMWSKNREFPEEFAQRIKQINRRAGLGDFDGYGYRRFYYEYVERLNIEDSLQFSDRADSGVRYLLNRPLVPNRANLRRQINPPISESAAS